jgi:hypothetical protein
MYMHEQEDEVQQQSRQWYVMTHLKPQWIEVMLRRECEQDPFEFFIPFLYMRPDAADDIRTIFHHFVFIQASEQRLRALLGSEWNTTARLHLRHYSDRSGRHIVITDEEYRQLRATFLNQQLKVFFGLPVEHVGEMAVGDRVTLLVDGWRGRRGKIERIRLKKGCVSMVVAVDILGHTKSVNFEDLHDGDVVFADHDTQQLLSGNLISNMEGPVATMLGHHFEKNAAEKRRRDFSRLNRFLSYANILIDDEADRQRFLSLMLMCATMLGEKALCERFAAQLKEWLDQPSSQGATDVQAYMQLALFVYTHNPVYRDAAKAYRKAHPGCQPILGTFINKLRDIPTVKPV